MKTPPFLLGATLLFWGWQTDFLIPGVIMGAVLEGARYVKNRWDLTDEDFKRIWTFCALLFLAAAVYAFADNGGPGGIGRFFDGPTINNERMASLASARTAAELIRWVPMIFFLFIAAQAFSTTREIPLHTISLILQRRWKQAKKLGRPLPATRGVDVSYPYFAICLFAASVHKNENNRHFFWGLCVLLGWVLWVRRPRRFGVVMWACALALAVAFGYTGARTIGFVQRYVDTFNVQLLAELFGRNRTDPFKAETEIGRIGRIETSTAVLLRLIPESGNPPDYLREASYRSFRSPNTWTANRARADFSTVEHTVTNENTWILTGDKANASRIGIACYLSDHDRVTGNAMGLLPLPTGSTRLENLPAYVLEKNRYGAVLAQGPGLVQFDVLYGPGLTIDGPPETNSMAFTNYAGFNPGIAVNTNDPNSAPLRWRDPSRWAGRTNIDEARFGRGFGNRFWAGDLQVPTNEVPALESVISEINLRDQGREETLDSIREFFETKFTYRLWQDADNDAKKEQTPLARFLLKTRSGHCEYFATATTLLLRQLGIPARYAVGYSVHEAGMDGFLVRQRDAHAWCIVWNDQKKIWEDFDTTPGAWRDIDSRRGGSTSMADAWWWVKFQFSKLRWGQTHLRQYILVGLVPVLIILLLQIIRQRHRRGADKNAGRGRTAWPGLDSEFYEIEKQITQRGLLRGPNEALAPWLERAAAEPSLAEVENPLRDLLRLHYRYRFDPNGLSQPDRDELRRVARECREKLSSLATLQARGGK